MNFTSLGSVDNNMKKRANKKKNNLIVLEHTTRIQYAHSSFDPQIRTNNFRGNCNCPLIRIFLSRIRSKLWNDTLKLKLIEMFISYWRHADWHLLSSEKGTWMKVKNLVNKVLFCRSQYDNNTKELDIACFYLYVNIHC